MARKEEAEPVVAAVAAVIGGLVFPPLERAMGVDVGVQAVRRSTQATDASVARSVTAFSAAEASDLFGTRAGKGGGAAFAAWAAAQGYADGVRLTSDVWKPLIDAFAGRPLHGHRRTSVGGNHRPNRQHLR